MKKHYQLISFVLSLIFMYTMIYLTFTHQEIFWYLYTFTLLISISIAIIGGQFFDQLPTWHYLIYGIGYGTVTYGIVRLGYIILPYIEEQVTYDVKLFLDNYGPSTIWHYLLLIFIIVIGEEMFWRGFIQQQLKRWTSSIYAVFITAILFSIALAFSHFTPGVIAAFFVGLIFGGLYEWKKSLPLIIVAHTTFIILLFLILPLTS